MTATEEAEHYAKVVSYLSDAFMVSGLGAVPYSLYSIDSLFGAYDIVLCAGVLYHVTDPVRALRIMFERLADGGTLLLETAISEIAGKHLVYCGPQEPGYRWFLPTAEALLAMLKDVGFTGMRLRLHADGSRATVVAKRKGYVTTMTAGVSR